MFVAGTDAAAIVQINYWKIQLLWREPRKRLINIEFKYKRISLINIELTGFAFANILNSLPWKLKLRRKKFWGEKNDLLTICLVVGERNSLLGPRCFHHKMLLYALLIKLISFINDIRYPTGPTQCKLCFLWTIINKMSHWFCHGTCNYVH